MKAAPIEEKDRIIALDIIRGLAILGIFLVNMPSFFSPMLYVDQRTYWNDRLDIWTVNFVDIVAQASFYTLFSFLFGYGFIIFMDRLKEKELSVPKYFSRRLIVLLAIGCIHTFLIWHGDILISYAITGFLLLLMRNLSSKAMVWTGILLITIPTILLTLLMLLSMMMMDGNIDVYEAYQGTALQSLEIYANGSFMEITRQRMEDWAFVNIANSVFIVLSILPMFLFGAAAAKERWLHNTEENLGVFKKLWALTLVLALIFKLLPYYAGGNLAVDYLQDSIGGPASALFYFLTIVLATRKGVGKKILSPLRYVGKMSLTNYLFQSVLCTFIFYSYGLGLYGTFQPFQGLMLVLGVYVLQIFLSKLWLSRFYYGPMEWLWRMGTYGRRSPLRKSPNEKMRA
ncbi:DUF418 domain-containing protein [Bacillus tianshenii]|uniref:DUF418 domain-containing protein n=1 Tax=Sutcliffiella tianshenii TaxID=1463404 RepID=UPI001CD6CD6B|nr:DUF418 domain-containing protein [Bacillus tianshenii]MCA1320141.1 DUF418 domain-containing protein [Bacillus tianshenii]